MQAFRRRRGKTSLPPPEAAGSPAAINPIWLWQNANMRATAAHSLASLSRSLESCAVFQSDEVSQLAIWAHACHSPLTRRCDRSRTDSEMANLSPSIIRVGPRRRSYCDSAYELLGSANTMVPLHVCSSPSRQYRFSRLSFCPHGTSPTYCQGVDLAHAP